MLTILDGAAGARTHSFSREHIISQENMSFSFSREHILPTLTLMTLPWRVLELAV
jgi:hypothetical protein